MSRAKTALVDTAISDAAFAEAMRPFAIADGHRIAVAVSGGVDSMALLRLLQAWAAPRGIPLTALTVDHRLRAAGAAEAEQVAAWCAGLGIAHATLRWDEGALQAGRTRSPQTAARAARYALLTGWCREHGIAELCLAHHADDQVETFFLRLARGSGVDGLAGMLPARVQEGIRVLRPLLSFPKSALAATCREAGQSWCEDPSNENLGAARVRFRKARALLAAEGFTDDRLLQTVAHMQRARAALAAAVDGVLREACDWDDFGVVRLDWAAIAHAPEEIALRALAQVLGAVGGTDYPPRFERLQRLYRALTSGPWRDATLSGCAVQRHADAIVIAREAAAITDVLSLAPGARGYWDRRFLLSLAADAPTPVRVVAARAWATAERAPGVLPAARAGLPLMVDAHGPLGLPHFPATMRREAQEPWKDKVICHGIARAGCG